MAPYLHLPGEPISLAVLAIAVVLTLAWWAWRLAPTGPAIEIALQTHLAVIGVATTVDGRTFSVFRRLGAALTPQVGEWQPDGSVQPFPTADWNTRRTGSDAHWTFVHANALRVGSDGALWVVDSGNLGPAAATPPEEAKLVRINLITNRVARIYSLEAVASGTSYLNDVRFHAGRAYLTDSGRPGLVVLDLASGQARRVLENHPALVAYRPTLVEGRPLRTPQMPGLAPADALELSPDGRWLYFASATGPMCKIATQCLNDEKLNDAARGRQVRSFANTSSTGGTAMDASGTLYLTDKEHARILRITPAGRIREVAHDERLGFADALWITDTGDLLAPAAQPSRAASLNGGVEATPPFLIYRLKLGLKPLRR